MFGCLSVDYSHDCNGLLILWNDSVIVGLISYSTRHIDVNLNNGVEQFHFTDIYGYGNFNPKYKTWELLDQLRTSSSLPWLVGGDLNEILNDNEKQGGWRRNPLYIANFRDSLSRNQLVDCKLVKGWFTWSKLGPSDPTIREGLDRFLTSADWLAQFPDNHVHSDYSATLDHCVIVMDTTCVCPRTYSIPVDHFCFENC
ncbi:hypothetical protein V6N13_047092 [Hibiscus sabdariffa]